MRKRGGLQEIHRKHTVRGLPAVPPPLLLPPLALEGVTDDMLSVRVGGGLRVLDAACPAHVAEH